MKNTRKIGCGRQGAIKLGYLLEGGALERTAACVPEDQTVFSGPGPGQGQLWASHAPASPSALKSTQVAGGRRLVPDQHRAEHPRARHGPARAF